MPSWHNLSAANPSFPSHRATNGMEVETETSTHGEIAAASGDLHEKLRVDDLSRITAELWGLGLLDLNFQKQSRGENNQRGALWLNG